MPHFFAQSYSTTQGLDNSYVGKCRLLFWRFCMSTTNCFFFPSWLSCAILSPGSEQKHPPPSYESSLPENSISPHIKARYITLPHKYNPFRIQSKVTQKVTFFFPNSDVSQARAFKGQSSIRATLEACLSDDVGLQWLWGLAGSSHTWGIVKIRPPLLPLKSLIA